MLREATLQIVTILPFFVAKNLHTCFFAGRRDFFTASEAFVVVFVGSIAAEELPPAVSLSAMIANAAVGVSQCIDLFSTDVLIRLSNKAGKNSTQYHDTSKKHAETNIQIMVSSRLISKFPDDTAPLRPT